MRIKFDDNSFIDIDESDNCKKCVTIVLCGINGKTATMSSVELDMEQAVMVVNKFNKILEKEKENG